MEVPGVLLHSIFTEDLFAVSAPPAVVIDQPWETIPAPEKLLLEKILAAIKQSFHSVAIKYQAPFDLSTWSGKPSRVIYFGKPVKGIPLYEVVEADGVAVVASETLASLLQQDEARKKLWQALKKQFSI